MATDKKHPHNAVCPAVYNEVKDVEPEVKLTFEDMWNNSEEEGLSMPDLRAAFAERRKKVQEMSELQWIEDRLRREDEIKEILKLSGMSHAERQRRLTLIEQTARDLKTEFKAMICKLTTLDAKVDALVDSAREYEKAVMYKPGIESVNAPLTIHGKPAVDRKGAFYSCSTTQQTARLV